MNKPKLIVFILIFNFTFIISSFLYSDITNQVLSSTNVVTNNYYSPYQDGGWSASIALMQSFEYSPYNQFSALIKVGIGRTTELLEPNYYADVFGAGAGIEGRYYIANRDLIGAYTGVFFESYIINVPSYEHKDINDLTTPLLEKYIFNASFSLGLKLGYKWIPYNFRLHDIRMRMAVEPALMIYRTYYFPNLDFTKNIQSTWTGIIVQLTFEAPIIKN